MQVTLLGAQSLLCVYSGEEGSRAHKEGWILVESYSGLLTRAFAVGWTPTVLSAPVKSMGAVPDLWRSISNYFGDTEYGMYGPRAHVGCTTWEGISKA